jgi:uncharacterized protein YcbK (DUF882 family)
VLIDRAREFNLVTALARSGAKLSVAGLILLGANNSLQNAIAEGDTRTLSFHHAHTGEDITVTFKRDGRYDEAALKKLDWFMRDWRKEKETHMDPHLFDLLWEVYREVDGKEPIDIICGYRSPGTNAMLRRRSNGVARFSQHINGKAIDFFIPGVSLAKIRAVGLRLQRGGVGFYPTSGSPFVHMDTASIRHWPTIPRQELVKIFPDGRTVHIPADGKPLRNYALALADVEQHGDVPNARSLEAAREAGLISASQEQEAVLLAARQQPKPTLLARLFGFGRKHVADTEEEAEAEPTPPPAPKQPRAPLMLASVMPKPKPVATTHFIPLPTARPAPVVAAAATPQATEQPAVTASLSAKLQPAEQTTATASLSEKPKATEQPFVTASLMSKPFPPTIWPDPVRTQPAAPAQSPFDVAAADSADTGSTDGNALSYAAESDPAPVARVRPMGRTMPRLPREATVIPSASNTTVAVKPPGMSNGGQRYASPWLRAAMLTPDVSSFMTTSRLAKIDSGWLAELLDKPQHALMMTFSADPHLGMVADRFSGHAVVFLATATFTMQVTASLR